MDETMENRLRESQLFCIGKLLASYTHELKNHLAIINESSGLMGDLLEMTMDEEDKTCQRFKKIIGTIGERIAQANTMAKYLNSFGHRMDVPLSNFNVNDLLTEELALIDRGAGTKKVEIKRDLEAQLPSVLNNASLLQFVVFILVQELIEKFADGGVIEIRSHEQDQKIQVRMTAMGQMGRTTGDAGFGQIDEVLQFVVAKMAVGFIRKPPEAETIEIILTIPLVPFLG
nr:HAMP domain-containing histidine kinase [Desulfobulbaceae bacterium]